MTGRHGGPSNRYYRNHTLNREWMLSAACRGQNTEIWFGDHLVETEYALDTCADCTVINNCLEYALAGDERFGIWGGKTQDERAHLKGRSRAYA